MVSDLYEFDLETLQWELLPISQPDDDIPGARYFHSADSCEFTGCFLPTY